MTKSELVDKIAGHWETASAKDVERAVQIVLAEIAEALERGERVEVRGFGSFSAHYRGPRVGRNPRTGERIDLAAKHVPFFKAGKELRERVNRAERNRRQQLGSWASKRDGAT